MKVRFLLEQPNFALKVLTAARILGKDEGKFRPLLRAPNGSEADLVR